MYELRNSDEARHFLLQGLWFQRLTPPRPAQVRPILQWALEIAAGGQELPPLGFVADAAAAALAQDSETPSDRDLTSTPALPLSLLRRYEDHVLGKLYADASFARAGDALRRYKGRDRARGLAFVMRQFAARSGFHGVRLNPSLLKSLLEMPPEEIHALGFESLTQHGLHAALTPQYEMLIAAVRRVAEMLGPEDISLLERGAALKADGEQLAERQVLRAAHLLESALPRHPLRPRGRSQDVPTHLLDEDAYPVGGFSSLATRGSIESLLYSQLAYMEEDERPDLFDIKFLRDELLYYARDENQFHRRRRTFVFVLYPDLDRTRFKDRGLEFQRGVLLLALLFVVVRKLSEWLSSDALAFRFLFVAEDGKQPLKAERDLLASLFLDEVANGSVELRSEAENRVFELCTQWARRSLCQTLLVDTRLRPGRDGEATIDRLCVNGPHPLLADADSETTVVEDGEAMESWTAALRELLQRWI